MAGTATETTPTLESGVLERHRKFLEDGNSNPDLREINESAIARFEELKFPHSKHDMFTFVNTKELAATSFALQMETRVDQGFLQSHIYPGCKNSVIVICDGNFRADLSNTSALGSSLKIIPLSDAVKDDAIRKYLLETVKNENDVFASINAAFFNQGLMLEVPDKAVCETPFQILYISTGSDGKPVTSYPRVLVKLGILAEAKIIIKFVGDKGNYFVNSALDFIIGEDAGVTCSQIQADDGGAWNFNKTRISLFRNGRFVATNASSGCKLARNHLEVCLKEEGAEMRVNGVSVLIGNEQAHNFIRVYHQAPHCTSAQHFKNVINDKGRSSFDGAVIVEQGAQMTYSDQLINNLMLSDDAHADSKPVLRIFADDVKCTHGATVGQIDEDQLFYLKTRGLSQEAAKALLTTSFAKAIVQTIAFPEVIEDLDKTLLNKLKTNHA